MKGVDSVIFKFDSLDNQPKLARRENLLTSGVLSIIAGASLHTFMPQYNGYAFGIISVGSIGVAYYLGTYTKFNKIWKSLDLQGNGAYPLLKDRRRSDDDKSTKYRFTLPAGLSIEDFDKHKLAIEQFLGKKIDMKYTYKEIYIEVFDEEQGLIDFKEEKVNGNVAFCLGYDIHGNRVTCDLSKNEPHMLVCGTSGSGKSVALRVLITSLILYKDVDIHLIDFKMGAEFKVFEKSSKVINFAKNRNDANVLLNYISRDVDRRYDMLCKYDCVNIQEYNDKVAKMRDKSVSPMRYQVVIIDEFAEMADEKDGIKKIQSLTARARAAGMSIILSTQRPSADVINGRIKANCGTILGLKTKGGSVNSRIVIDRDGLEDLRGLGHAILQHDGKDTELQCMNLSVDQARDLIKHTYIDKSSNLSIDAVDEYYGNGSKLIKNNQNKQKSKEKSDIGVVDDFDFLD